MNAFDLMTTRVVTIRESATVGEAVEVMLGHAISGLPVVDAHGRLVGIVTEGDFLRRTETGTERHRPRWLEFLAGSGRLAEEFVRAHGRHVSEVMTREVVTVREDTSLADVAALMERHRIKRLPVMRGDAIVGIISRRDLMHALADVAPAAPASTDDAAIRSAILAAMDEHIWAPRASVRPVVRDGVVDLRGFILDERHRQAMRVLVENVPGVRQVEDHLVWIEPATGFVVP